MSKLGWLSLLLAIVGCSNETAIDRIEWMTMSTIAAVQSRGGTAESGPVRTVFAEVERLLNAHNLESEISRLAVLTNDDEVLRGCDARMRECYRMAFRLRDETKGAFNPRYRGTNTLDLGAIAKGYAVDLAAEVLRTKMQDKAPQLIDLGGNLKAVGGDWCVGVKDGESFTLKDGEACATSATYYRGNHITDARTGAAVSNRVYSVTVIHPHSAMIADGLSTVMFILGREQGEIFIKEHYPEAKTCWIFKE